MTPARKNAHLLVSRALDLLGDVPGPLMEAADAAAPFAKVPRNALSDAVLAAALRSPDLDDPIQVVLGRAIARWDYVEAGEWTDGTGRMTPDRRALIYDLLGLSKEVRLLYTERFPPIAVELPVVIADVHEEWYPEPSIDEFYWKHYARYLADTAGWHTDSINVLDESTTEIIERVSCPWRAEAYQSKGLVVGYVQSGKTANFSAVIAKAVDAGYRLVIVLAGVLDVLRNQTQRRLDREIVGKELLELAPGGNEYASDQDWDSFIEHGGLPSHFHSVNWHRLTGPGHDYARLGKGVDALDFERTEQNAPLHARENLRSARARLIVVKKNPRILERVIGDLEALHRTDLRSIPALIIDDESDQASVDTSKLDKEELRRRTATNKAIRRLLKILPRAQYIGYTATPFANVFVDPRDKEDIFPRDFIISLPRPTGYMGVSDFFDMTDPDPAATVATSNEKAFVRSVRGLDRKPENLQAAIESFLISGAIKLYRQQEDPSLARGFRHHTMLVHSSAYKKAHRKDASFVKSQYKAVTDDRQEMWRKLEKRFLEDFVPVSASRGAGLPFPAKFKVLRDHVIDCLARLESGQHVRIVNGDNKDDAPDFDQNPIWSILVGGTKLSRGYTIEGLTVSYYRRTSSTADTLMQMGRWFGFRKGYRDLVRLYLGRKEPLDKRGKRTLDLLEAFKGTCRDEEEFRTEIRRYAAIEGKTRLRPVDVTPLVPSHMLRPTAANKMRYAKIKMMNFGERWSEKTLAPGPKQKTAMKNNRKVAETLLKEATPGHVTLDASVEGTAIRFGAVAGRVSKAAAISFLKTYQWADNHFNVVQREIDFLQNRSDKADPGVDSVLILAPQLQAADAQVWAAAGLKLTVKRRARINEEGRFKAYSEPDHRLVAEYLCGSKSGTTKHRATLDLIEERQAVLLLYPVCPEDEKETSIGFAIFFPRNNIRAQLRWAVESAGDRSEAEL